jgi:peptidoglycan/LPS O-acetylase OafA/YrhL
VERRLIAVKRLGHVPALDGLRGIAIAAVCANHFFGLLGGYFGVDLFFVLSGFLITTLLLEEREERGSISLRSFYVRRARRLFPALGAFLIVSLICVLVLQGSRVPVTAHSFLFGGFYLANIARAFQHPDPITGTPFALLWSLAQEEQFYLVWPLLLIGLLRFRRETIAKILLTLFTALVIYGLVLVALGASWSRLYYGPDTHLTGLVIGCFAAVLRREGHKLSPRVGWGASVLALGAMIGVAGTMQSEVFGIPLVGLACGAVVLTALEPGRLGRALSARWLTAVGRVSYSLYLWQGLALWLTNWNHKLLALGLSIVLATASYRLIENRFRRRRLSPPQQPSVTPQTAPQAAQL